MAVAFFAASPAGAVCKACGGGEEDWGASATAFLEGKSIENEPAKPWGPAAARLTNSQFSANSTDEEAGNATEESSDAVQQPVQSAQNIALRNASASPNPAVSGSPVVITAVLAGADSAYALINNFAGVQVGNVTLERSSGEEFAGTWTSSIASGDYTATIVAAGQSGEWTFDDALSLKVIASPDATGDSRFKKLG